MNSGFKYLLAAIGFVATSFPVHATGLQDVYSSFFVLGDSLSDAGNTPFGSITDGEVWAEPLSAGFNAVSTQNYATIGAEVIDDGDIAAFDLGDQAQAFKTSVGANVVELGSRPLVAVWAGANDVFSIAGNLDPTNPLFNEQRAKDAANGVVSTVQDLSAMLGIRDFVVFDLPDLGATPFAASQGPAAQALLNSMSMLFNNTLYAALDALTATQPDINDTRIPMFALINAAIADPLAYGVISMELPCNIQPLTSGLVDCTYSPAMAFTAPQLGFYDAVHPSSTLHRQIGEVVVAAAVAPVPLPASGWLLVFALGGLAARGRLRRSLT